MQEAQSSATEVFSFPLSITLIPVGVCVVCIGLAMVCFLKSGWRILGCIPLVLGLIAGGLFAPSMLRDRITISQREIATTTGFWFAPTRKGFVYEQVKYVRVTTAQDLKGREEPTWEIHYHDGKVDPIRLSDLWNRHADHIRESLRGRGVAFSD